MSSVEDSHFPCDYGSFQNKYGLVSNSWLLAQDPIDTQTLANRRATKSAKKSPKQRGSKKCASLKKKSAGFTEDSGPTEMYVNVSFTSKYWDVEDLAQACNIDVGTDEAIYNTLKTLQCWKSDPRYILVSINNGLCPQGVKMTLRDTFKAVCQKMSRRGKLNTLDFYDRPIPEFHVYLRKMGPLKNIPDSKHDVLSFDPHPAHTQLAYYIEASNQSWVELEPLIEEFVNSNQICKDLGPSAHFIKNPDGKRNSLSVVRNYQRAARCHFGYQLLTMTYTCPHVLSWGHPVRVQMAAVEETDSQGNPTGKSLTPSKPYSRTSL